MAQNPFLESPLETATDRIQQERFELPPLPQEEAAAPAQQPAAAPSQPKAKKSGDDNYAPPPDLRPLFESAARKYNVPVNVLMALGHQESRFDPVAIGKVPTEWGRAKGIMQYIDPTARSLGINPFDPEQAVGAAARQLRERLDKGYSMEDAVKEHFAGTNRARWGKNTAAYGREVLAKAARIAEALYPFEQSPEEIARKDRQRTEIATAEQYRDYGKAKAKAKTGDGDNWDAEASAQQKAIDDRGFLDRTGEALSTGYDNMLQSLNTARFAVAGGDSNELSKQLAAKFARESKRQKTTGEQEIDAAFKGVTDAKGAWNTIKAGANAIGTAITNPKDLAVGVAEQAANSLPTIGGSVAGAGTGAAAGAGVGAAAAGIGALPGAAAGALWGGRTGMVAGTTATELGAEVEQMVLERLQANKAMPTAQNIKALLDDKAFQSEALERGLKKGLTVAVVDQLFLGLGGKVVTAPARKLAIRDLAEQGIDVSTRAARNEALASTAGRTALDMAKPSIGSRIAAGGTAVVLDATGEVVGESASQQVARGSVDAGDALREGVYGLGQSVVEPAIGAGMEGMKRVMTDNSPGAQPAPGQGQQPEFDMPPEGSAFADTGAQSNQLEQRAPTVEGEWIPAGDYLPTWVAEEQQNSPAGPMTAALENAAAQQQPQNRVQGAGPLARALENAAAAMPQQPAQPDAMPTQAGDQPGALPAPQPEQAAPPYADRYKSRIDAIKQAKTQDEVKAILGDEYGDDERHMEGTGLVEREARKRTREFEQAAVKQAELDALERGEWVPADYGSMARSKAEREADRLNQLGDGFEYDAHPDNYDGYAVMKRKAAKQVDQPAKLEDMTEDELRARLKHLAGKAKSTGGWNKMLMDERRKIERQIDKLTANKDPANGDADNATTTVNGEGTYRDGGTWSVKYSLRKRTDGSYALVRTMTNDDGVVISHLRQDGTWMKGDPAFTAVSGANAEEYAPETFFTEEEAFQAARSDVSDMGGKEQAAPTGKPTPAPAEQGKDEYAAQPDNLEAMTEPELRAQLKAVAGQAKEAGWTPELKEQRRQIESRINKLVSEDFTAAIDAAPADLNEHEAKVYADLTAAMNAQFGEDVVAELIERAALMTDGQSAEQFFLALEGLTNDRQQQTAESNPAGQEPTASQPAEGSAGAAQQSQEDQAEAVAPAKDEYAGKWFGSAEKAQAFIDKKKAGATHEAVQTGKVRWEIKPKATVKESLTAEPAAKQRPTSRVVRSYTTKSGKTGATVKEQTGADGSVTYAYTGEWGAGSGRSLEDMQAIERMWQQEKRGFTVSDADGKTIMEGKAEADAPASRAMPAMPYANPTNSEEVWSGRGRKPQWVADYLNNGGKLEDLRVESQQSAANPNPSSSQAVNDFIEGRRDTPPTVEEVKSEAKEGAAPVAKFIHDGFGFLTKAEAEKLHEEYLESARQSRQMGKDASTDFLKKQAKSAEMSAISNAKNLRKSIAYNSEAHSEYTAQAATAAEEVKEEATPKAPQRFEYPESVKGDPEWLAPSQNAVVDFMNGEISKPALLQRFADLGLTEGQVRSVTNRIDLSYGEIESVAKLREAGKEVAKPTEPTPPTGGKKDQFSANKIFTADKVEAARARLKSKLGQLNSGIDPELLVDGMTIAGAYIEAGVRNFRDYAKAMTDDFGDSIKPYLLSFYEAARNYPGLDTEGMTPVGAAKVMHSELMKDTDTSQVKEAIGETAEKPAKRTRKTGAKSDMTLTQDWGVDHIDGWEELKGGANEPTDYGLRGGVKDAFLKEARAYLNTVAGILTEQGYAPHTDSKGRPEKPVSVNESGVATSGDVILTLVNPETGSGIYVHIGDTSLRGVVPTTQSGIAIMFRAASADNKFGTGMGSVNRWAPVDLSAADFAILLDKEAKSRAAKPAIAPTQAEAKITEEVKQNDTQGNQAGADDRAQEPAAGAVRATESQQPAGRGAEPNRGQSRAVDSGSAPAGNRGGNDTGQAGVRARPAAENADAEQPVQGSGERSPAAGRRGADEPASSVTNYRIQPGELKREGSWRATAERNIGIVELVKKITAEGRQATPEERAQLAKFTGWGASEIANGVFPDKYGRYKDETWRKLGERLQAALTPEEYAQARRTTQYAHYTSESVIRSIYDGLQRLGVAGGTLLEPGMGIGHFNGLMPDGMAANTRYTGIEYDTITGNIAKLLYPASNVIVGDYTRTNLPKDFFDAAIGNPPFNDVPILSDPEYKSRRPMLHDYFFMKTIDRVKPGGVLVFVTSKGTMDKVSDKSRKYLAERANLLGAVRLPQTAFKDNAGTEVVTDVIFLQKRGPGIADNGMQWLGTKEVQTPQGPAAVNEYFADHPDMILGSQAFVSSQHGPKYTVLPPDGDIEQLFAKALQALPENVSRPVQGSLAERALVQDRDFNPKHKKEGGLYLSDDGKLMQVDNGSGVEVAFRSNAEGKQIALTPKQKKWLRDYVGLRDALKQAQYDQLNDGNWEKSLKALNKAYDGFVKEHGHILEYTTIERTAADGTVTETKRYKNEPLLRIDAEGALAYALENVKEDGTIIKGAVLNSRVLETPREPEIKTTQDALFVSLNRNGALVLDDVATLAGTDKETVIRDLGTAIYDAPGEGWKLADDYLSGNVVRKLKEASAAAEVDPRYKRNVEALLAAQPRPLGPTDITVRLGANWVPASDIEKFGKEVLGEDMDITYSPLLNKWDVEQKTRSLTEWGFDKMTAGQILDAVLNNRQLKVTYRDQDNKTHVDLEATEKANDISRKMRERFSTWLWTDTKRAERLVAYYNENFNNIAPRQFDGSHLTLPGVSARFKLYPHQKRAVWRVIQQGDTYLAHAVGAGKTMEMIAAGMEERRLGLVNKPMYVVPNHMLAQFSREFLELYPAANIMVADEHNFHTHNRKRFVAQAALNNPDAIVITHSAFGRIGMSDEYYTDFIQRQIDDWKEALEETDDRITVKQIERRIEQLEQRMEGRQNRDKKDQVLSFEELGVDKLYVDEFHEFRKLDFATNQGNVKGIDPNGSQRALDLFMKVEYLRSKKPGRSLVAASGTPVTNTMGELFTSQRFFQPEQMKEDGLENFDAWSSQYGDIVTGFEQNAAGGYEMVARFAKFQNVPELMRRVRSFMDILTSSNLGELVKRPDVENGSRQVEVTPSPEGYKEFQQQLQTRIQAIRNRKGPPKKGEDIILNVIGDGRFSAIDMRFVDPTLPSDPNSKLNVAIDQIISAYKETASWEYSGKDGSKDPLTGSTIILFTDIGLGEQSAASRGFDMRGWIEQRLTEAGIPREHIAFMRDFKQHAKKERMFSDMREGKKRILIGGKEMETGTNVQKRLSHLFHLDAPWFPASVEQREGRAVRQGNQNKQVVLKAFATKGSYDSTMWGMNARKARFIEQAMNGDDSVRSMDDVSEASAFEMAAALASGDERYMKLAGLKADVDRLDRLRHAHYEDQNRLMREKHWADEQIKRNTARAKDLAAAIAKRKPIRAGEFEAKVGKATYDNREEFSQAVFKEFQRLAADNTMDEVAIGEIGGFSIRFYGTELKGGNYSASLHVELPGDPAPLLVFPLDPEMAVSGIATRAANQVNGLDKELAEAQRYIDTGKAKVEQADKRLGAPFPEEALLLDKVAELNNLETELAAESKQAAAEAAAATAEVEGAAEPEDETAYVSADTIEVDGKVRQTKNSIGRRIAQTLGGLRNFWRWFGDSQVVDKEGRPLVMYHGTRADGITEFKAGRRTNGLIFFTKERMVAGKYAAGDGYAGLGDAEDLTQYEVWSDSEKGVFDRKTGKVLDAEKAFDSIAAGGLDVYPMGSNAFESYSREEKIAAIEETYQRLKMAGLVMPVYIRAINPHGEIQFQKAEKIGADQFKRDGFDSVHVREGAGDGMSLAVFDPEQVKSSVGNSGEFDPTNPDIRYSVNAEGQAVGEFGPVTEEYRNDPAGAVKWLQENQTGEAIIDHPQLGEISLIWGDGTMGLPHIAARRGEDFLSRIPAILESTSVYEKANQKGRVFLGNEADEATIRLDWNGQAKAWLVSAYEKYGDAKQSTQPQQANRSAVVRKRSGKLSIDGLRKEITSGAIGQVIARLIDNGQIVLHANAETLPKAARGKRGVQAVTLANGEIHLVADSLEAGSAMPVLLHEMFHKGGQALVGSKEWGNLMGRLGSLKRQASSSAGKMNEFFQRANDRVEAARQQGAVSTGMTEEEFGAYAIEEWEQQRDSLPAVIRKWVDDVIGQVKAYVLRRFGKQLGAVTPAQLAAMAKMVIMNAAAMDERGKNSGDSVFSAKNTIDVDGVMRPTLNSNGLRIAQTEDGIRNFWRWFGDSNVVDSKGRPLVVYHGTKADIRAFDPARTGTASDAGYFGVGVYFAERTDQAEGYGSAVYPVYIAAKNVFTWEMALKDRLKFGVSVWGIKGAIDIMLGRSSGANSSYQNNLFGMLSSGRKLPAGLHDAIMQRAGVTEAELAPYRTGGELAFRENKAAFNEMNLRLSNALRDELIARGYDGIFVNNMKDKGVGDYKEWVAFHPEQIKSAIGNNGDFDPTDPDIRYSVKPEQHNSPRSKRNREAVEKNQDAYGDAKAAQGAKFSRFSGMVDQAGRNVVKGINALRTTWGLVSDNQKAIPSIRDAYDLEGQMDGRRIGIATEASKAFGRDFSDMAIKDPTAADKLAELMTQATLWQIKPDKPKNDRWRREWQEKYDELRAMWDALPQEAKDLYDATQQFYEDRSKDIHNALKERIMALEIGEKQKRDMLAELQERFDRELGTGPYFPLARFGSYLVIGVKGEGDNAQRVVMNAEYAPEAEAMAAELSNRGYEVTTKMAKEQAQEQDMRQSSELVRKIAEMIEMQVPDFVAAPMLDELNQIFLDALPLASARKSFIHRKNVAGFSRDMARALNQSAVKLAGQVAKLEYAQKIEEAFVKAEKQAEASPDNFDLQPVVAEMRRRFESTMRFKTNPVAAALQQAGFAFTLAYNLSSAAVNLLQMAIAGGHMGARHGAMKANAQIAKALGEIATTAKQRDKNAHIFDLRKTGSQLSAGEKKMLEALEQSGKIDVTAAMDAYRAAHEDTKRIAESKFGRVMQKVVDGMGVFMQAAEVVNRQAVALAAYRMELQKTDGDVDAAIKYAAEVLDDTQFNMNISNQPRFMHNNVWRVVLQYKGFAINMMDYLGRTMRTAMDGMDKGERRQATKALGLVFGMQVALAGIGSLPLYMGAAAAGAKAGKMAATAAGGGAGAKRLASVLGGGVGALALAAFLNGAFGDDDEPWDWKADMRRWLAENTNATLAQLLDRGLFSIAGVDIADRISMNGLMMRDLQEQHGKKAWQNMAEEAALGMGGVALSKFYLGGARALDAMEQGNTKDAFVSMLPLALANAVKGVDMAANGVIDKRTGAKLMDVNAGEAMVQMFGFQPSSVRERRWADNVAYNADKQMQDRKSRLLEGIAKAVMADDSKAEDAAWQAADRWNEKNGDLYNPITQRDVNNRVRQMEDQRSMMEGDGRTKGQRQQLERQSVYKRGLGGQ